MRIIAGEFRGRKLLPPPGEGTRPITDRAKQSLFDVLAPVMEGASVYDCFAGTGSMGLEALSRGASHATFFEFHRPTAAILRRNIETVKVERRSTVVQTDFFRWFATAPPERKIDLVFLDPPYEFLKSRCDELREAGVRIAKHLAEGGLVVFRHHIEDSLALALFSPVDVRDYGTMRIEILKFSK
jgi:16S rRNA (guanine966-N2)-methyltransferase